MPRESTQTTATTTAGLKKQAPLGLLLHLHSARTGPTWMQALHQQTVADLLRDRAPAHQSRMTRVL